MPALPDPSKLPTERVRNPRTGELDYAMPVYGPAEAQAVVDTLRAAQPAWSARSVTERLAVLEALAHALLAQPAALIDAISIDTGRRAESVIELHSVVGILRRWVEETPALLALPQQSRSRTAHISIEQRSVPYGVAVMISPWNFPLLLSLIDAVPALAAGNAVLIKPSEATPRFVPVLRELIAGVPGLAAVLQLVTGPGSTGEALVRACDMVCFTGSVKTGRRVAAVAAEAFVPAHLELGGKDPAIVCADADLPRAARALAWGSMGSAGQSCMSIERCYVERCVLPQFLERLTAEVGALRHAWPQASSGPIGPIIAAVQEPVVRRHLEEALAQGARALTGGRVVNHGGGAWCEPTVLVDVHHGMAVMREESFAAILPVIAFNSDDEAVALANDSEYGLSACVFSSDLDRARRIAGRLQAGAVSINDAALTAMVYDAAKQSFKMSGLGGSRMGGASLARFYRQQAFLINDGTPSPWWFPAADQAS